jgi:tetratricopeptide (TPR) repeat protein
MLLPSPGALRPDRRTPLGNPPARPALPPRAPPPSPAPPPSSATPVPTPFPAGQAAGFRVLSRTEAQKVADRAPPPPPPSPAAPAAPPKKISEADNILSTAGNMERRGDVAGAIYVLKRGIAQLPRPGPLYNKLALILIHQRRDYRQAEELLHRALALEPENEVYEKNLYKVVTLAALQSGDD